MTDIAITAANVIAGSGGDRAAGIAAEAITAGQAVYSPQATGRWLKADSNSATAEARKAGGIALNGAAIGQPLFVLKGGDVTIGATLAAGSAYYLSDTPGGICPFADIGTDEYVCQIGLARSTTVLSVDIQYPNVKL